MQNIDTNELFYPKNVSLKTVLEDGIKETIEEGADGFSYIVGEIGGMEVRITMEPKEGHMEILQIDGVNGFGYCLVGEK